jgi:hypothetical protein
MGNQQPCQFGSSCYDGFGYEGCCLPIPQGAHDEKNPRLMRPLWLGKDDRRISVLDDDDSYAENYRFNAKVNDDRRKPVDQKSGPSLPATCRSSSRVGVIGVPSISLTSSHISDADGASPSRGGFECRSDPSMIQRTTTSQCERDDVDDEVAQSRDAESGSVPDEPLVESLATPPELVAQT